MGIFSPNPWVYLGSQTLGSAGDTISVTPITAMTYLRIEVFAISTGGTINTSIRFNNDTGNNYSYRNSQNGAADTTGSSQSAIVLGGTAAQLSYSCAEVVNVAAQEKLLNFQQVFSGTAGAANVVNRSEGGGKWANTADLITRVDSFNGGTGDYNTGSMLVVFGHN